MRVPFPSVSVDRLPFPAGGLIPSCPAWSGYGTPLPIVRLMLSYTTIEKFDTSTSATESDGDTNVSKSRPKSTVPVKFSNPSTQSPPSDSVSSWSSNDTYESDLFLSYIPAAPQSEFWLHFLLDKRKVTAPPGNRSTEVSSSPMNTLTACHGPSGP